MNADQIYAGLLHLKSTGDYHLPDRMLLAVLTAEYQKSGKLSDGQLAAAARLLPKYNLPGIGKVKPQSAQKTEITGPPRLIIGKKCHLQNVQPDLIAQIKKELTVPNPKHAEALRFGRWIGPDLLPEICCFGKMGDGIVFPHGFLSRVLELCPDAKTIDDRKLCEPVNFNFSGMLRPYQRNAVRAIRQHDEAVLESGTGSGKTVIGLAVIAMRGQPTIIFVHSKELLYQWAERIEAFLGIQAGLIGDGRDEIRPVTVAIINSAKNRLDELPKHFGQVIVDEAHRVPASMFTEVVTAFDCKYLLGLSATAFRHDGLSKLIEFYIGPIVHRVDTEQLHKSGAVLRPEFVQIPTRFSYFYRGDYQSLIKALVGSGARNQLIVDRVLKTVTEQDGIALVVSDRVGHCRKLAALLREERSSIRVKLLVGQLDSGQRDRVVADVRAGRLDILIATVQLIGEGFDCPGLDSLFLTTPIKAKGRLIQVIGRILRPAEGKTPMVYDFVDPVGVLQRTADIRAEIFKGYEK